ncbi:MAG: indolepyruvate oxidoreductase subunit beta family protein [Betaproteobacteria bacterium]|nr:indolepyruvate oxidoreductase subunit beta family protein [Betaproteobacteria bacterium]
MDGACRPTGPITILVGALGGEGGGTLAQWLVEAATAAGYPAQATSIPGVAQRTGATTYYVEVFPRPLADLSGRRPVLSLLPVPGCIDVAIASELLEAARIVGSGMVSPERTLLVASTSRTLTTTEKMAPGDGRVDSARLLDVARVQSARLCAFDMDAAAKETGTVVSAVMLGAIAGSGTLPFARDAFEAVVRASGRGAEASLAGFARGWDAVRTDAPMAAAPASAAATPAADPRVAAVPAAARDFVALGHARVVAFQDEAYGERYLARVARIAAAERACDPDGRHAHALTRETARYLALWMAFDDVVRVAGQKSAAARFARVRREAGAGPDDVVHIVDHFRPGIPECVDLLPPWLAARVAAWDRARQARGLPPWSFPLRLRSDSATGFLALRLLAGRRGMRRRGARFAREQADIDRWLAAIERAAAVDWSCAFELAQAGRLIKGYGATNERGKRNLAHILDHLADGGAFATPEARADALRQARVAALADEGGQALDAALVAHGVPARSPVAQPIRWQRRTPAGTGAQAHPERTE